MDFANSVDRRTVGNTKSETDHECGEVEPHDDSASSTSEESYPAFETLYENKYLGNKKKRVNKEIRRMSCDCSYSPDEIDFAGCGDDCLNRLLMIECNSRCPCGEFCSNRKFQEGQKVCVEAFRTEKKGWGLRTLEDIVANQFVMEYCGEVMGYEEFEKRVEMYDKENRRHYYFMTLKADEIIDATYKGNLSRFINHSCSPNCETQKWTVNGYLRIGFFTIEDIKAGMELTFDYKFQRYGKKAQPCYCLSENCCGIIGGEKHTPLKSIISGRPASPATTSSPRRNRRRRLAEQFDDKPLELEIAQLLAGDKGIKTDDQTLKLSQFMVRAENTSQRLLLLDTLMATIDQNCLRNFVKYQGLSLLWSWMVDLGENSLHLQKKIVQVLKHLPVANLNQVKDTKVLKVISKWAKKPSVSGVPEEETSSSDVDSRGRSPQDASDDTSRRESHISSSSDELQGSSKSIEISKSKDNTTDEGEKTEYLAMDDNVFEPNEVKTEDELELEGMRCEDLKPGVLNPEGLNPSQLNLEGRKPEGFYSEELNSQGLKSQVLMSEVLKSKDLKPEGLTSGGLKSSPVKVPRRHKRNLYSRIIDKVGDSSEEESSRWSEDDTASSDSSEGIVDLAANLLDQWSNLKEVYRIPKKSTIVVQREPESTSGITKGSLSDSNHDIRAKKNAPVIPKIDEDLFKKDEFLSKLGERDLHNPKSFQRDLPSSEITSLVPSCEEASEGAHDTRLPIHQRLQHVAATSDEKQFPPWHGKAAARRGNRKGPYGPPKGPHQEWPNRHQTPKTQFNPPNPQMHLQGMSQRPNMPNNQWNKQESPPYPQYLHEGGVRPSGAPGYPPPNQNQGPASQPPYFQQPERKTPQEQQTGYQTRWNSNPKYGGSFKQESGHSQHNYGQLPPPPPQHGQVQPTQGQFPPGSGQMPPPNHGQPQYNTGYQQPFGYQQQNNQNPAYSIPMFNQQFMPNQNNATTQQQLPPGYPPQFPKHSASYTHAASTSNVPPAYSVPTQHQPEQQSRYPLRDQQHPGSNTAMVSSTVGGSDSMDIVDPSSKSEWPSETYNKTQEVHLPPDWKKAYDGEGRAYFYHVVTRQTQWEPPVADRSPPTPELGYLGDELDSSVGSGMFSSHVPQDVTMEVVDFTKHQRKKPRSPSTPPGSPPKSPVSKYTTAAADTTDVRKGLYSPSSLLQGRHLTPEQRKRRETFRMKLSACVVNYLNPYHKLDCKVGRITNVDDFKFLARKLTHGVMVKELNRIKDESTLVCNDSVKIKTKEYIRRYMQKFGPVFKPS